MEKIKKRSDCPISGALDIVGDKWTLLILRDFIFFDNRHFNRLVTIEQISTNILTNRLKRLLDHGIIKKEIDQNNKSSFLYSLTNKGLELVPIVLQLYCWGSKHIPNNNAEASFKQQINTSFEETAEAIIARLQRSHGIEDNEAN